MDKYEKYFKEEFTELEKFQIQNSNINFEEDPDILRYDTKLTDCRNDIGLLKNIAIFVSKEDHEGYLVYQEKSNDLIVINIRKEEKIKSLEDHKNTTNVIRYYDNKNNISENEEYILSCDNDKLLII